MQQIPRRILIGGSLGLAAAAVARPSSAASTDLTVGVPANLLGLDPADVNDTLSQSACRLMMQGLYGFDKDMNLIPVLAESYTASEDAKEFTFKLRSGISFHDGTPFNAAAVKANFDRVTNPANHLKRRKLLRHKEHRFPCCEGRRNEVGDCLRFAGAWRTLDHKILATKGMYQSTVLRAISV